MLKVVVVTGVSLAAVATLYCADGLWPRTAFAAEKIPVELQGVGIDEKLGAQVDLNLTFRNEKGESVPLRSVVNGKKPVMLFLAYYGCPGLCNLFLNGATSALKQFEWNAGKEFEIVTVSIDPTENAELATAKKASHIEELGRADAAAGWHFWINDVTRPAPKDAVIEKTNARVLAEQVGFNYTYDKEQAQYAHVSAIIVLTPEGKVSRYLYGIEFRQKDLRLALVEASQKKIGTIMDRFMLFCYNYDPKTRKYSLYATNLMRAGGGLTVLILGGILFGNARRTRREGVSGRRPEAQDKEA